ncbi:MAG: cell division protein ZapA [Tannerella sp.]|jgi:cell division protein ZapA|nr:cell division protein ZapA [Tannerella sp.]
MPDKTLDIQLEVIPGGRKYPVKINADDEELIREATRQLRLKFNAYNQAFSEADLSDKDIMAMVAIDVATSHLRLERNKDIVPFTMKIQQLNEKLKDYLKEQ